MPNAQLTITNGSSTLAIGQGRTFAYQFDHAAMVAAGQSRADGSDFVVLYGTQVLNTWLEFPNTANAILHFRCMADIAASGSDSSSYILRYGDLGRQDRVAVPTLGRSWAHPIFGDAVSLPQPRPNVASRVQPFFFSDFFTHDHVGPGGNDWNEYTTDQALDNSLWGSIGGPYVRDGEMKLNQAATVIANPYSSTAAWTANQSYRQVVEMKVPSNASIAVLDGLLFLNSVIPNINTWGLTTAGHFAFTMWFILGSGTLTTVSVDAVSDVRDRWIRLCWGTDRHSNGTSVRYPIRIGVPGAYEIDRDVTDPTPAFVPAYVGPTCFPDVSGEVCYRNFRWEQWDGIDNEDITISAAIPTAGDLDGLDICPSYPVAEVQQDLADRLRSSEYLSTKSKARVSQKDIGTWEVVINNMRPDTYWAVIAAHAATRGAGTVTWTPPGGSQGTYAFRSLDTGRAGYGSKTMTMILEKV